METQEVQEAQETKGFIERLKDGDPEAKKIVLIGGLIVGGLIVGGAVGYLAWRGMNTSEAIELAAEVSEAVPFEV